MKRPKSVFVKPGTLNLILMTERWGAIGAEVDADETLLLQPGGDLADRYFRPMLAVIRERIELRKRGLPEKRG